MFKPRARLLVLLVTLSLMAPGVAAAQMGGSDAGGSDSQAAQEPKKSGEKAKPAAKRRWEKWWRVSGHSGQGVVVPFRNDPAGG